MVRIKLEFLTIIQNVLFSIPPRTPKRDKFVAKEYKRLVDLLGFSKNDFLIEVDVDIGKKYKQETFNIDSKDQVEVFFLILGLNQIN